MTTEKSATPTQCPTTLGFYTAFVCIPFFVAAAAIAIAQALDLLSEQSWEWWLIFTNKHSAYM